jgi:aerobic-type carbon monoxide dehydrogenase small subunit (CoxS/CutS family)
VNQSVHDAIPITLEVNGTVHQLEVEPWVTLLDLLRERLKLTGSKKGCDHGQCGACTVLVDGQRINSCSGLAVSRDGAELHHSKGLAKTASCIRCRRLLSSAMLFSAATAHLARSARQRDC